MPLYELVTKYKLARPKLRREITILAGGRAAFQKLRAQGAGGSRAPFGGKRQTGRVTAERVQQDDSKAWKITSAKRSKGWSHELYFDGHGVQHLVHISPKGKKFIEARANEPADMLYESKLFPGTYLRFVRFEKSAMFKKLTKLAKQETARAEEGFERRLAKKGKSDDASALAEFFPVIKKRSKKVRRAR